MNKEFQKNIEQLKNGLKNLITDDTETTKQIAELDKIVDSLVADNEATNSSYNKLKDDYIELVKNSGFKSKSNPVDDDIESKKDSEKTFEECIDEVIAKRDKNKDKD